VGPPALKSVNDVLSGVPKWEGKIASLFNRHREELSDQMKLAIFIYRLPPLPPTSRTRGLDHWMA
jgi:hypothetical protein